MAKVGEAIITVTEFSNSYQSGPSILKDLEHPKLSFLDAMIQEELLAEMLRNDSSFTQRPAIKKALKLLKQELLVERLFKEEVHDKIHVSKDEIRSAILKSNLSVKAKYMVTTDKQFAFKCLEQLDAGLEFDSLLNDQAELMSQTAYMDTTDFLKYGELEKPLNESLFNLNPLQYSEIIPIGDSYIILQNTNMVREINTEGDINKYHDRYHKILTYQKRLSGAHQFVKEFMDPLEIQVVGESFVFLVNVLYELYVNIPYEQKQMLDSSAENPELPIQDVIARIQDHKNDPAVRFKDGVLSVQELLDQVLLTPFHIEASDKQNFSKELNADIAIALRDYFMELEAIKRAYDQEPEVQNELLAWKEKLIVQDYISDLRADIVISNSDLDKQVRMLGVVGDARRKQAEQQLLNLKCKAVLDQRLDSLMSSTEVHINNDLLKSIEVEIPAHRRRPDVHLFKLGLPYLRSAFPTPNPIWGIE